MEDIERTNRLREAEEEQLYIIRYIDEKGERKTYMNNASFTEQEAIREIVRTRRQFPNRKYVRKQKI